ncbi:MAG: WbqC family protein [Desulfovibrionaceae bacterium]
MSRTVAIHQPNFFPWLGYFAKIARADVFVFLDGVDYPKSGKSMGSYSNRVKLDIGGEARWWGCPVVRESGPQPIREVFIRKEPWREKVLKTLEQNYSRASRFAELIDEVRGMVGLEEERVGAYNIANVRRVCELLGLSCEFVLQSEVEAPGHSTELLVNVVRAVGGSTYLSGTGGAKEYQDESMFAAAGVELLYSPFRPEPYERGGAPFLPGLSVLDALLHLGPEGTRALLL